jgi:membrane protein
MTRKSLTAKGMLRILKATLKDFSEDKMTRLSGALSYYTVFSLAPLLVVLISLAGLAWGKEAVEGQVYETLDGFLGPSAAAQFEETIQKASLEGKSTLAAIIGGAALLLGATTVFAQIQDAINEIWDIKARPKRGWLKMIKNRLLSFSLVIVLGFLLLVSLAISAVVDLLAANLQNRFPDVTVVLFFIINLLVSLFITTILFAVLFKILPDAKIRWRDAWPGAITTGILFILGKYGISAYISTADVGGTYGAAGSLVILIVWVYYASLILYIGAAITKNYASEYGHGIEPKEYAVKTKEVHYSGRSS